MARDHHISQNHRDQLRDIVDCDMLRLSEVMLVIAGLAAWLDPDLDKSQELGHEIKRVAKLVAVRGRELKLHNTEAEGPYEEL